MTAAGDDMQAGTGPGRDGLGRAHGGLLAADVALLVVLAVTGVGLTVAYRPRSGIGAAPAYTDMPAVGVGRLGAGGWLRVVHLAASWLLLGTVAATVVVLLLARWRQTAVPGGVGDGGTRAARQSWLAGVAVGPALALLAVGAVVTGALLPWDSLALWATSADRIRSGYLPIITQTQQVKFVVVGGADVAPGRLLGWYLAHLGLGLAGLLVAGWLLAAARRRIGATAQHGRGRRARARLGP
jgi:hypothetical protein